MKKSIITFLAIWSIFCTLPSGATNPTPFDPSPPEPPPSPTEPADPLPPMPTPVPTAKVANKGEHPRVVYCLKATVRVPKYLIKHPYGSWNRLTYPIQHPLKTGKWMEQSGFNGLLAGLGALGNLGTTAVVSAKRSI